MPKKMSLRIFCLFRTVGTYNDVSLQREHVTEKSQFHKHYTVYHGLYYVFAC